MCYSLWLVQTSLLLFCHPLPFPILISLLPVFPIFSSNFSYSALFLSIAPRSQFLVPLLASVFIPGSVLISGGLELGATEEREYELAVSLDLGYFTQQDHF